MTGAMRCRSVFRAIRERGRGGGGLSAGTRRHGELLVCGGKRARRNSNLESSTAVSRYGSVFDDAAQDDAYIASVSEYFQMGQLMGERVEYTAMSVIEKKMNEGLLLLEDMDGDPLYLVKHLSDFVELRKTHETFEEFMMRTNRTMRSPNGVDAQNRVIDLVTFVETQRTREKADRMSTSKNTDAASQATATTQNSMPKQPKKQPRRRAKRRRREENSRHWREFRQLYGYGLAEIESDILLYDEEDDVGDDDDVVFDEQDDNDAEVENEDDEDSYDDIRREERGEIRMPEPHSVKIVDRLEAVRSLSIHDKFDGRISRLADFGVVVSFMCNNDVAVDGVLYLPDCFEDEDEMNRITHPEDIFKIGDALRVSIAEIDATTARLRLRLASGRSNLMESVGEMATVHQLCDVLRDADGIDGIDEGPVLDQYQNRGVSLQILMHDEDMCGGFEFLMREERKQQRIFILTTLSREDVGKLIKQSFDKLR